LVATISLAAQRLRQRFERAPLDTAVEVIRIGKLTTEEHARWLRYSAAAAFCSTKMTLPHR
jgi:hypothetical protein